MSLSGILSGLAIIIIGGFMIALAEMDDAPGAAVIGLVFIATGVYMIANTRKEDAIEQIKKK